MSGFHDPMEEDFDVNVQGMEFGIELPPDEAIDASWEKVKSRLKSIRREPKSQGAYLRTTALETLDNSSLLGLYLDAVMLEATEDFLELIEEIMLNRSTAVPLLEAAFLEYKARSAEDKG